MDTSGGFGRREGGEGRATDVPPGHLFHWRTTHKYCASVFGFYGGWGTEAFLCAAGETQNAVRLVLLRQLSVRTQCNTHTSLRTNVGFLLLEESRLCSWRTCCVACAPVVCVACRWWNRFWCSSTQRRAQRETEQILNPAAAQQCFRLVATSTVLDEFVGPVASGCSKIQVWRWRNSFWIACIGRI